MPCCLWFCSVIGVRGPWPKRYGYHLSIYLRCRWSSNFQQISAQIVLNFIIIYIYIYVTCHAKRILSNPKIKSKIFSPTSSFIIKDSWHKVSRTWDNSLMVYNTITNTSVLR